MDNGRDDSARVEAARHGDGDAFAALVGRHQEVAFRAAYLIVRDAAVAEDVAQEAFVRAYQNLRTFRPGEPFRPWLLRIATNLALNHVRGRTRRLGMIERFRREPVAAPLRPEDAAVQGEEQAQLLAAINHLSPDDRLVLYLRWFLELPEREIAGVLGKPPGTVKSRLSRAGTRLRAVIERHYPSLRPGAEEVQRA